MIGRFFWKRQRTETTQLDVLADAANWMAASVHGLEVLSVERYSRPDDYDRAK